MSKFQVSDYVSELYIKYLSMTRYTPEEICMAMNDILAEDLEMRIMTIEQRKINEVNVP